MAGCRISLDLAHFYSDFRRKAYVYIDFTRYQQIHEVESHIHELLPIEDSISLVVNDHFLPHGESIAVLNENDIIQVVPTPKTEECPIEEIKLPRSSGKKKKKKNIDTTDTVLEIESASYNQLKTSNICNSLASPNCIESEENTTLCRIAENDGVLRGIVKKGNKSKYIENDTQDNTVTDYVHTPEKKRKRSECYLGDMYVEVTEHEVCNEQNSVATHINKKCKEKAKNITYDSYSNSVNTQNNSKATYEKEEVEHNTDIHLLNEIKVVQSSNKICEEDTNKKLLDTIQHTRITPCFSPFSDVATSNTDISIAEDDKKGSILLGRKRRRRHKKKTPLVDISENTVCVQPNFINPTTTSIPKHIKFKDSEDEDENINNVDDKNFCSVNTPVKSVTDMKENDLQSEFVDPTTIIIPKHNKFDDNKSNGITSTPMKSVSDSKENDLKSETWDVQTIPTALNISLEKRSSPLVFHCHTVTNNKNSSIGKVTSDIDYSKQPSLQGIPREKDIIAFKLLKLGPDYSPEISCFVTGKVLFFSEEDMTVKLQILNGSGELKEPHGKFSLSNEDDGGGKIKETVLNFKELLDVKILFP